MYQIVIGKGVVGALIHEQNKTHSTIVGGREFLDDGFDTSTLRTHDDLRVIIASVPSQKWKINHDNSFLKESVSNACQVMNKVRDELCAPVANCCSEHNVEVVLISSTDYRYAHSYGLMQRVIAEEFDAMFSEFSNNSSGNVSYKIVMLPALAGKGVQKNAMYDLTHTNTLHDYLDFDTINRINAALSTGVDLEEYQVEPVCEVSPDLSQVQYLPSKEAWESKGLTPLMAKSMIETEDYFDVSRLNEVINTIFDGEYSHVVRVATIMAVSLENVFEAAHNVNGFVLYQESTQFTEAINRTRQPLVSDQSINGVFPEIIHIDHDNDDVLEDLLRLTSQSK